MEGQNTGVLQWWKCENSNQPQAIMDLDSSTRKEGKRRYRKQPYRITDCTEMNEAVTMVWSGVLWKCKNIIYVVMSSVS